MQVLPDHVVTLSDAKIHTRSDLHGSYISAKYSCDATVIYDKLMPNDLWETYIESYNTRINNQSLPSPTTKKRTYNGENFRNFIYNNIRNKTSFYIY